MKRTAIIMAGGSGERFWPLSRRKKPKQLLKLASEDKMMIEESIERISPLIDPADIFIITGEHLLDPIRRSLKILPPENVVAEPAKRNTAPCLGLGAAFIAERYSETHSKDDISIAVLTADQNISPKEGFVKTVEAAMNYVEENPVLATIGIPPSRPETGYGYIEVVEQFDQDSDVVQIKPVLKFREKPEMEKAKEFIKSGKFLWNSGMFFWRLDTFEDAMVSALPEVGNNISEIQKRYARKTHLELPESLNTVSEIFENFPNISIDYGLMERAKDVVVVKALFDWDDIGSWDSLERVRDKDDAGNIKSGEIAVFDIKDSIIINESEGGVIAAFGLEDVVIVKTDDAVLVCPKGRVQEVKKAVEMIRKDKGGKWL